MSAGFGGAMSTGRREGGHPGGGDEHGHPNVLSARGRDIEQPGGGSTAGDEARVDDHEQRHTADIPGSPTESRDAAGGLRCGELSQHRVVRDAGEVVARRGEPEKQQSYDQIADVLTDQAHRRREHHHHRGEHGKCPSTTVRHIDPNPRDRGEQRDRDARIRTAPSRARLSSRRPLWLPTEPVR